MSAHSKRQSPLSSRHSKSGLRAKSSLRAGALLIGLLLGACSTAQTGQGPSSFSPSKEAYDAPIGETQSPALSKKSPTQEEWRLKDEGLSPEGGQRSVPLTPEAEAAQQKHQADVAYCHSFARATLAHDRQIEADRSYILDDPYSSATNLHAFKQQVDEGETRKLYERHYTRCMRERGAR